MVSINDAMREVPGLRFVFDMLDIKTAYGKDIFYNAECCPPRRGNELFEELCAVAHCRDWVLAEPAAAKAVRWALGALKDIRRSMRAMGGTTLSDVELFEIKCFLINLERLRSAAESLERVGITSDVADMSGALSVLDPGGEGIAVFSVYDGYSERLAEIRKQKLELDKNERAAEIYKNMERGALTEERRRITALEQEEELAVRKTLTLRLYEFADAFEHNFRRIARLDYLLAKAQLAADFGCVLPQLADEAVVEIENAGNPYLESMLTARGLEYTPVSISLERGASIITGANMGGKSAFLKALLQNVLLVQLGFLPFADKMRLCLFDSFGTVIDDDSSLKSGLSSFGAQVFKLREIIAAVRSGRMLILIDELAGGTNPEEGRRIFKSVVDFLGEFDAVCVFTTHFSCSTRSAARFRVAGLRDDIEPEPDHLRLAKGLSEKMDYRIEPDDDGRPPRDAINICRLLGLDEKIIDGALKDDK